MKRFATVGAVVGAAAVLTFAAPAQAEGGQDVCTPKPAGEAVLFEGWPNGNTIVYDFEHTPDVDEYGVKADGTVDFTVDAPAGHHFVSADIEWDSGKSGDTSGVRAEIVNGGKTVKFSGQGPAGAAYVVNATVATDAVECQSPPAKPKKCKAYVYAGTTEDLCAAGLPEEGEVNCDDVKFRVTLVDAANDPWGLDGSGGGSRGKVGVGCESKPLKPADNPPAAGADADADADAGAGGKAEASLPVTGASVPVLGGVAVALLVGGGIAVAAARRRREPVFEVGADDTGYLPRYDA